MEIYRPGGAAQQTKFSRLEKHEPMAFEAAAELTEKQIHLAVEMLDRIFEQDARRTDGAVFAGVVNALATNFAAITISRAELQE